MGASAKVKHYLPYSIPVFILCLVGCTTYQVEYDRMTGTAYPPSQTIGGNTVDLSTIYGAENYLLVINEDTTNIQKLAGTGNCINEAELDAIETANRTAQVGPSSRPCGWWIFSGTCTDYNLYGVVVNHYYEEDAGAGACRTGVMGLMWTDNRRAFANFYSNTTVSGDNGKYLRSTAHEIGHAFNLHHEDGDGSTTIMNQTGTVGDTYNYNFTAASKNHLKDHPERCVRPGVGTFGSINTLHDDHTWTTEDCEVEEKQPMGRECGTNQRCCEPAPDGSCYLCFTNNPNTHCP